MRRIYTEAFTLNLQRFTWAKCRHWKPQERTKESCCDEGAQPAESRRGLLQHVQEGLSGSRDYDSSKEVLGNKRLLYLAAVNPVWCILKGTVAWDAFSLIASYPGQKERIQKNFHVLPIFTELGQDLTHLAHTENTQTDIFLWDRRKIEIAFFSLKALIYYPVSQGWNIEPMETSQVVENFDALSEYAKAAKVQKKKKF